MRAGVLYIVPVIDATAVPAPADLTEVEFALREQTTGILDWALRALTRVFTTVLFCSIHLFSLCVFHLLSLSVGGALSSFSQQSFLSIQVH